MLSMRLSSSCGWSVTIRHQSDQGVAVCVHVYVCVCVWVVIVMLENVLNPQRLNDHSDR